MSEIYAERVSPNRVIIQVGDIEFVFVMDPDGFIKIVSKSKLGAQVHDPGACWVPQKVFLAACRQAAAILRGRDWRQPNQSQPSLDL